MSDLKEYGPILGVAIRYDEIVYRLPSPNRHHHVIRAIRDANGIGVAGPDEQGFYSKKATFMTREFAMEVAVACGQLKRKPGAENYQGPELFSEDLW